MCSHDSLFTLAMLSLLVSFVARSLARTHAPTHANYLYAAVLSDCSTVVGGGAQAKLRRLQDPLDSRQLLALKRARLVPGNEVAHRGGGHVALVRVESAVVWDVEQEKLRLGSGLAEARQLAHLGSGAFVGARDEEEQLVRLRFLGEGRDGLDESVLRLLGAALHHQRDTHRLVDAIRLAHVGHGWRPPREVDPARVSTDGAARVAVDDLATLCIEYYQLRDARDVK
mmetsp:Transcript_53710/g.123548  ORF Transcript_53710/g.123548 Transcript_53710/m.123548 type:complete len:227 (+) Transcript_53710:136-816(+)